MLLKFHGIYQQDDRDQRRARTQARRTSPTRRWCARACRAACSRPTSGWCSTGWPTRSAAARCASPPARACSTTASLKARPADARRHAQPPPGHDAGGVRRRGAQRRRAAPRRTTTAARTTLLAHARHLAAHFRPKTSAYYEVWLDGDQAVTASPARRRRTSRGAVLRRRLPAPEVQDRPGLARRQLHRRLHPRRRHRAGRARRPGRASSCSSAAGSA